nr:MAG TPA: hypothetical protein [Caudoviricetes sp.]
MLRGIVTPNKLKTKGILLNQCYFTYKKPREKRGGSQALRGTQEL